MTIDHRVEELEKEFTSQKLNELNHFSNIFNNMRYRGWYQFIIENDFFKDIIVLFRVPPAIPLYDNVLRHFPDNERMAGIHRMLIGKELREEVESLMKSYNNNIGEIVNNLSEDEVQNLVDKFKNIITFDCNKIPYLHIRIDKNNLKEINSEEEIKKFIQSHPIYLDILYDVLNEKISIEKAEDLSNKIIYNEFLEIAKKGLFK